MQAQPVDAARPRARASRGQAASPAKKRPKQQSSRSCWIFRMLQRPRSQPKNWTTPKILFCFRVNSRFLARSQRSAARQDSNRPDYTELRLWTTRKDINRSADKALNLYRRTLHTLFPAHVTILLTMIWYYSILNWYISLMNSPESL